MWYHELWLALAPQECRVHAISECCADRHPKELSIPQDTSAGGGCSLARVCAEGAMFPYTSLKAGYDPRSRRPIRTYTCKSQLLSNLGGAPVFVFGGCCAFVSFLDWDFLLFRSGDDAMRDNRSCSERWSLPPRLLLAQPPLSRCDDWRLLVERNEPKPLSNLPRRAHTSSLRVLCPNTNMPASAAANATPASPEDTRCAYPGKKCLSARAVKPNGTLHKLCEVHRRRANLNQKRLQQKRRLLRDKLFKRATGVMTTVSIASSVAPGVQPAVTGKGACSKPSAGANAQGKRAGSAVVSELLFAAAKKPNSPASSSSPFKASSPVGVDMGGDAPVAVPYMAQLEYLFADPLLCHSQPLNVFAPAIPDFSNEDVFMLQDALFRDFYYPTTGASSFLHQQHEGAGRTQAPSQRPPPHFNTMSSSPVCLPRPAASVCSPASGDVTPPTADAGAEFRCSYRSKPCKEPRATKVNGELHKLCDFHRKRANVNQQRVHLRRRISKKQAQQLEALYGPLSGDESFGFEPYPEPCGDLTLPELQLLELLLSDNPEASSAAFEGMKYPHKHTPAPHRKAYTSQQANKSTSAMSSSPAPRATGAELGTETEFNVPAELRCTYRSKPCGSMRAIKANGEHHKLCDLHRKRANINQQRVHLRRRLSKRQLEQLDQKYGPLPNSPELEEYQIEPSSAPRHTPQQKQAWRQERVQQPQHKIQISSTTNNNWSFTTRSDACTAANCARTPAQ
ncbi:hypothetical protein PybrP1_009725 [[Pythium] brassicae (nom. inval.)]|nr:hypothetical protein PybrP1_009725 [[Pythium] brassicae (nom. inval.)]